MKTIRTGPYQLESGYLFNNLEVAFHTYGNYKPGTSKVIWVCHALTANSDVEDWWPGLFGSENLIDPDKYFIVCANNLGSPYGTTSPLSINPKTEKAFGKTFPEITVKDMAGMHIALSKELGIDTIDLLVGGSQGGQQAMEWAISKPNQIKNLLLLACNAYHSPWGIAFNETQRMALETKGGLKLARAIALLSYRSYESYGRSAVNKDKNVITYQHYQGEKLAERFDTDCYRILSLAMDSHDVGRTKESREKALADITAKTLVIGISSDLLFPISEQRFLAEYIPQAQFESIHSTYGHDGFLVETEKINKLAKQYFNLG